MKCETCGHENWVDDYKQTMDGLLESEKQAPRINEIIVLKCLNCGQRIAGIFDTTKLVNPN